MDKAKKYIAYTMYIFGITVFFLYTLFPSDTFKSYIEHKAAQISPDINFYIEKINPGIPPGISFSNIYILFREDPVIRLDNGNFTPVFLSFFSSEPKVNLNAATANGELSGVISISGADNRSLNTQMRFASINLREIPIISSIYPGDIAGTVRGEVNYETSLQSIDQLYGNGNATLNISGIRVDLEEDMLKDIIGIDHFTFSSISADVHMENRHIRINKIEVEGAQFSGSGNGTLTLKQPTEDSRIDLTGSVQIHPEIIHRIGPLLPDQYLREGKIPVRITGTLSHPRYSMR